jgi:hypothetical protein
VKNYRIIAPTVLFLLLSAVGTVWLIGVARGPSAASPRFEEVGGDPGGGTATTATDGPSALSVPSAGPGATTAGPAILLLTVLAVVLIHLGASWATTRDRGRNGVLIAAGVVAFIGVLLTVRAVIGLLVGHVARAEPAASTPLAMATGPALVAYACWLAARVGVHHDRAAPALRSWYLSRPVRTLRLTALAAAVGLAVTGLFWAGTSFAWRLGEGRAYDDALQLPGRPEVVLDTGQRLIDLPPFVQETKLPAAKGDRFHYRYRGLRLLIQAGDRLFLVPGQWTAQGRTLVIPYDDSIRLQVIPKPGG